MPNGDRPNIPKVVEGTDLRSLPIGPLEGFVLTRIDGALPIPALAEMTGQPEDLVREAVEKLVSLGAAEWVDGTPPGSSPPDVDGTPVAGTGNGTAEPTQEAFGEADTEPPPPPQGDAASAQAAESTARSEACPADAEAGPEAGEPTLYDPAELEEDVDLPMERRKRVLDTYYRLSDLDFYALLGVARTADKKEIRSAYFALSKVFHPDTLYGRDLGSFKQKMERVFRRITEAYETLGKKKSRAAYDDYLGLKDTTDAAEQRIEEVDEQLEAIEKGEPEAAAERPAGRPAAPRPPSDEVRRQLFARRLGSVARQPASAPSDSDRSSIPPQITPPEAGRREVLRGLAQSLKQAAGHTGGGSQLRKSLAEARAAEEEGDLVEAANALRLASALAPDDEEVQSEYLRVHRRLAKGLADNYQKQAIYEEERQEWKAAALSWSHVCEGRSDQAEPHRRGALALVKASGDLRQARDLAQKAVDLEPRNPDNRRVLGQVYRAAGMKLNARRELEEAAKLDPEDEIVKNLLRELNKS